MKSIAGILLLLLALTLSFAPVSTYAQGGGGGLLPGSPGQGLEFEHLTVEQGLSEGTVTRILQDRQGFMWFCTSDGLNRYDGYAFTVYRHNPDDPDSLSSNDLNVIYEDTTGALWIGTNGSGLERFDRATERFTHYAPSPDDPKSLMGNIVRAIYQDRSGALWVGANEGLNKLDRQTGQFAHYTHVPNVPSSLSGSDVRAIYQDRSGVFWVGTYSGLDQFDGATGQVTARYRNDPAVPTSLSNDFVEQIYEDAKGNLWVGTRRGLNKLDRATGQFKQYLNTLTDPHSLSNNAIRAIYEDPQGVLWVGTDDGINTLNRDTEQFTRYYQDPANPQSLSSSLIQSVAEDRTGAIWIGTFGSGINRLDRTSRRFALYSRDPNNPQSLSSNNVMPVYEDREGNLWVGTNGGGLDRIDRKSGQVTHYRNDPNDPQSLGSNVVTSIAQDPAGTLWVAASHGGLNRLDPATGKFTRYRNDPNDPASLADDDVWKVWVDRAGTLWVGTSAGLDRFDPTTNAFVGYQYGPKNPYSLSGNDVRTLYEDSAGTLWVGTLTGGLNRFNQATDTFTRYQYNPNDPRSLSSNQVNTLYQQDSTGNLWIGTAGGLDRLDAASGAFVHYRKKDGLPDDNIQGILEDSKGNLWLSTNGGLSKFNPQTGTFKNYDARDGLQSAQFNAQSAFKSASGEMFFGGPNGLNAFFPDQVTDNPNIPNVVLTGFRLLDRPVLVGAKGSPLQKHINETERISLSHEQSAFSFEFAALNYRSPDKNRYMYKLEGFDKDWNPIDSAQRVATYTDVPPGDYVFQVKASNNDGVWNETGKAVKITVTPPWWQTTWFRVFAVVFVLSSVYGVYLWRVNALQSHSRQLERLVAERTADLKRHTVYLEGSAEVGRVATSMLEPDPLMQQVVELIRETFGLYYVGLFIVDDASKWVALRAGTGEAGQMMLARGHHIEIGIGMIGLCAANAQARIALDAGEDSARLATPELPDTRSEAALPLRSRDRVIGALTVQSARRGAFDHDTITVLQTMADQVAVALDNAGLFQTAQAARAEAEEANRLKSQFLANMSHELRTPLNSVINFAYLLSLGTEGPLSPGQEDLLNRIGDAGRHLLSLINDILDLAKIESGRMELFFEDVDLHELINGVLSTAVGLTRGKPIELRQELPDDLPLARADRTRVRQVLLNLLSNAAKFTERGLITVRAWADEAWVTLSVQDTGIGIAAGDISKAFAEFVQVDGQPTRRAGGTGLGLPISKHFVEMHGGRIWVESQVGVGSTFFFTLPRVSITPPGAAALEPPDVRVLVVDDDPVMREVISRQLAHGYQVQKLTDSRRVVEAVRQNRPDVVVLDILMPHRDGWEVLQELKTNSETQDIPVVVCSVLHEQKLALSLGADGYLVKPVEREELRRAIGQFTPSGGKVLAVDDDPDALDIITRMLDGASYQVTTAQDGWMGLAAAREQSPDVMVLDLMMPGLSGFEVLAELRSDPRTAALPVVIVTAKDLTVEERAQLQAEAAALLLKGQFSAEEFANTIRRAALRGGAQGGAHG